MTALTLQSDSLIESLFAHTNTLVDDAKRYAGKFKPLVGATHGAFQRAARYTQLVILAGRATNAMKESIENTRGYAEYFQSFHAKLMEIEGLTDQHAADMLVSVIRAQESTVELRNSVTEVKEIFATFGASKKTRSERVHLASRLEAELVRVFAILEKLRWEILESEADYDIANGRVSREFSNVEDLFAELND